MGNKMIGKAVNQFIQIAGMWALVWGALGLLATLSGFISVRCPILPGGVMRQSI